MDDEHYLSLCYKAFIGRKPDLRNPKSFNEKLQWLKLHDRNPLYTMLVDKYQVKKWVAGLIGERHVARTYGVWKSVNEIDISGLPERFVLKTNHDSGGIAICSDRETFDFKRAKLKLSRSISRNFYWAGREWPYKNVRPLVFAEEYLEPDIVIGDLVDYKFMCFNGEPRCVFTCSGRAKKDLRVDFFDMDWNHLPFRRHYPNAVIPPAIPVHFQEMAETARRLTGGGGIPFVRVDFYEAKDCFMFGEMTLFPGCGFEKFYPEEWDELLGSWIDLSGVAK